MTHATHHAALILIAAALTACGAPAPTARPPAAAPGAGTQAAKPAAPRNGRAERAPVPFKPQPSWPRGWSVVAQGDASPAAGVVWFRLEAPGGDAEAAARAALAAARPSLGATEDEDVALGADGAVVGQARGARASVALLARAAGGRTQVEVNFVPR